jgi:predicted Zn-dependent protease
MTLDYRRFAPGCLATLRMGRAACSAAVFALAVTGCAVNPVTGERQLALISEQQEIALGADSAKEVQQSIGFIPDAGLQSYVATVGKSMAVHSERPDLPWEFHVVDDPSPNAFALPGGYIFITRGLMDLITNEAELAAVLGHEIGHVTARHSVTQLSRAQLAQLGLGLGSILSPEIAQLGQLASQGLGLLFLKYGRDAERQADELGFRYMLAQGYQVSQMAQVFAALEQSSKLAGASPLPDWLSSHPSEPERIANTEARIAALPQTPRDLKVGRDDYLPHINNLVYGSNPRNGFFRGDWFYHPELAFRFAIPEDWQRQNLTEAVQAISPQKDAAAQLTIAKAASPAAAAQTFLSQQGVQVLGTTRRDLDGNPAVIGEFQVAAQNGAVHGYVTEVMHGNTVYELIAYAPAAAFAAQQRTLERIVTSFSTVRDRDILGVQPRRVEIVKLPRAMTLRQFADRYPSSIELDELGLINQIDSPDREIMAGTLLKRVTGMRLD